MTQCLIVDGGVAGLGRLGDLLEPYGFALHKIQSSDAALEHCRRDMPDVIVVADEPDKIDALAFIRKVRRQVPGREPAVLVCSSSRDAGCLGRQIWGGASDFLMQPYDAAVLDSKLRQIGVI